ncbi:MAG: YdcF family protein, partial [Magnetococcales bacterium]|nr:YdcF family protein [Magnetococcales bacterium]
AVTAQVVAFLLLYLSAIPLSGRLLSRTIEFTPPLTAQQLATSEADVIVILGHSRYPDAPEYGGDTVTLGGLARVRYGAWLHRRSGLPILTSGGRLFGEVDAESVLMKRTLEEEFGVPVRWTEEKSRNTFENAKFSKELLDAVTKRQHLENPLDHVLVVTHHRDMPRAMWSFKQVGLKATAAPTLFPTKEGEVGILDWMPVASGAARKVRVILHEQLGSVWYRLRYGNE